MYLADGSPAQGTVLINWSAFVTPAGQSVPQGSTSVTLTTGGVLNMRLAANAGASPVGSYYTAVYHLSDGTVTREYWVVPVSTLPVTVAAIRNSVLPSSVAMQTVTKNYVNQAIAQALPAASGGTLGTGIYVQVTGDTMTGPLVLPGDPAAPLQAADKNYVDENITAVDAGLAQKVSTVPSALQTVTQPLNTSLGVNDLNGEMYASQYQTLAGNNGIANAAGTSNCLSTVGCDIVAEPTYPWTESWSGYSLVGNQAPGWPFMTYLKDLRGGAETEVHKDAHNVLSANNEFAHSILDTRTRSVTSLATAYGASTVQWTGLNITQGGLGGGNNIYPVGQYVPYFKSTYSALELSGAYESQGQKSLDNQALNCYGVGDCLIGSRYIISDEGLRDNSDEGVHPYDIQVNEDPDVASGVCSAGCTTGSTAMSIGSITNVHIGEGRFLIDKNPAKMLSSGLITGGTSQTYPFTSATFSGTSFPISTFFLGTAAVAPQTHTMAPGTVTVTIATTGLPSGYSSNTAAAASSGVACIADTLPAGVVRASNYEMANYQVLDATHMTITFNKPHGYAPTIAVGGLCGYGLEQTIDTVVASGGTIRQVVPVVGSYSTTALYYAANNELNTIGVNGTSRFLNFNGIITSISRTSNVATVTLSTPLTQDLSGTTVTIAGVADSSYNGTFAITTTSSNSFTYTNTGANSTSSGGTVGLLNGGFNLYPMAETLSVMNSTTNQVDGSNLTLAPNTVAWASGDAVEMPHFDLGINAGDTLYINEVEPRPNYGTSAAGGINFTGTVGPDMIGFRILNTDTGGASAYFGNGGTMAAPLAAMQMTGTWQNIFSTVAGDTNLFNVGCNSHGCGKWNSNYNLFALQSNAGPLDTVNYNPLNSNLTFYLSGSQYAFTPTALSAPALKAAALTLSGSATVTTSSGTGSEMATATTAIKTNGDCVKWDVSGNLVDAGAACGTGGGGGSSAWSALTVPTANLSLGMGSYSTAFTYGSATGSTNLFNVTDTAANTGTGVLMNVGTAAGSAATPLAVYAGGSGTPSLSVAANGSVVMAQHKMESMASCIANTAQPLWNLFDTNAPVAGCIDSGSNVQGFLRFIAAPGTTQYAVKQIWMPANLGTMQFSFKFRTAGVTGNVVWGVQTACVADGSDATNPTFGTAATVTTAVPATANLLVTSANVTASVGSCAAGSELIYQIYRSTTDTDASYADLLSVQITTLGAI